MSVIVIIIGIGLFAETRSARQPVATVYDETITTKDYKARQTYERTMTRMEIAQYDQYMFQYQSLPEMEEFMQQLQMAKANLENQLSPNLANLYGGQVLDGMIEEALVRHETNTRDLTVSESEIDERIEEFLGYAQEDTESITETAALPDFSEYYGAFKTNILDASGFSERSFREMIRSQVLREQLVEAMGTDINMTTEQVTGTLFVVDSEESAEALRWRINQGDEPIEEIAAALNDPESFTTGSFPITWVPQGYLASRISPDIERVAWSTSVGQASPPVQEGEERYYVFYVGGREERPLDEMMLQEAQQQHYTDWLEQQQVDYVVYEEGWQDAIVTTP